MELVKYGIAELTNYKIANLINTELVKYWTRKFYVK